MDRAKSTGQTPEAVERDAQTWSGEASARRNRELVRITASLKHEIARAEHGDLKLGELLSNGARERLNVLRRNRVRTVVLDECHHLASLWGYVVRAAVEELGDVHLVGLTATPPDELTKDEDELYSALLGPVDFTVPTPAVVRERFLAPYQELAWLTPLLETERAWLAEHDVRFQELITTLHDESGEAMSLPSWVITRMRERGRDADESAVVPWLSFQRTHPSLGARHAAAVLERQCDVLFDREPRHQIECLKDEADLAIADLRQTLARQRAHVLAIELIAAGRGRVETTQDVHQRAFARTRRSGDRDVLAGDDPGVDAAQGLHVDLPEPIGFLQTICDDQHDLCDLWLSGAAPGFAPDPPPPPDPPAQWNRPRRGR